MKVIILSSGTSSRLRPLTDHRHKCLIEIGGKPLVEYQLDSITRIHGIEEIVFIIGHKGDLIRNRVGDNYNDVRIKYIYNDGYLNKRINYTLYKAKWEIINRPFIYLEGDILFHRDILLKLIENSAENCLVVDKNFQSKKVDTIVTGKNGSVKSLLFEEHGDFSNIIKDIKDLIGEMILMVKFDRYFGNILVKRLEKYGFDGNEKHLYLIFDELFREYGMSYLEIENIPWVEVDNFEDLKKAEFICQYSKADLYYF